MRYQIGDKVKLLNDKGGGIITKIISSSIVGVSGEDGFELPTLISNLIPDNDNDNNNEQEEAYNMFQENASQLADDVSKKADKGIYIAFVPQNQKWLITGDVDIYIINNCPDTVIYNIYLKNNSQTYQGFDYGSVEGNSKVIIATQNRDELVFWTKGIIQIMYHSDTCQGMPSLPENIPFKIKSVKFLKEENYTNSVFFDEKAIICMLTQSVALNAINKNMEPLDNLKENLISNKKEQFKSVTPKSFFIDKHKIDEDTAEVDLHIDALTDDAFILTPYQKLQIQKDYFSKCLDSAMAGHYKKVIFVHGVGNGILKREIENILREIEGVEYYDAPMNNYGFGATVVILHHNILK